VLVLNPGTANGGASLHPLARFIVGETKGWQVWAVERRENLLEDQSVVDEAKAGTATTQRLFDYYLGYLTDSSIIDHYQPVPDSAVPFAREWGMRVAVEDLRRVVREAKRLGGEVVLGGHSIGGVMTNAYATWDFSGKPGAKGLAGLVFIDGVAEPEQLTTVEQAREALAELEAGSPWFDYGGIPAPLAGLFALVGSTATHIVPNELSDFHDWPLTPENIRAPVPVTNEAGWGYAFDVDTSPPELIGAQAHLGHLAESGDPRPWVDDELTPVQRWADMFSGTGLRGLDGGAWYHPQRLTIDAGAVAAGNANRAAQEVLDVRATHVDDLRRGLKIYAFAAGGGVNDPGDLDNARAFADASQIPKRNLTLVDREATYMHGEPLSAFPKNVFVDKLAPFLRDLASG
jgi:hypothetical protein